MGTAAGWWWRPARGRLAELASALLAVSLGAGCVDEQVAPAPVPLELGGSLSVAIVGASRLVVAAADGRLLLDGLPPGEVAADGPPLVGFAVRDATPSYEMKFGAFRPSDEPAGPWRVGRWLTLEPGRAGAAAAGGDGDGGATVAVRDGAGAIIVRVRLSEPEAGHLVAELEPGPGRERRVSWGVACDGSDHFVGLGAQSWDVDHRGQSVPCLVQEQGIGKVDHDGYDTGDWMAVGRRHSSHAPIPQLLARRGYALTVDTTLPVTFALCSESAGAARIEVNLPASVHLFDGPSPAEALERASGAFGRPRLPPRVAFAPWLDAIYGSENVRRVAERLRAEQIPASVIWTEDWRGGEWTDDGARYELREEWEVDRTLYPDFEQLAADLHGLGFDLHVYFNPFVYEGSKAWSETQPQGWLVQCPSPTGDGLVDCTFVGAKFAATGLLDLDHPEARQWAVSKMQQAMALGADGWMNDYAEWLPTDSVTAAGPGLERHNAYPVRWQQVARQAIDTAPDGAERLFFGRSGWLGTPALADVVWAGDQRTTLAVDDGMPTVVPIGIGLGVAGVSTYGHDIAGYQAATNGPSTREVFYRWTELGAWSPVMRTHHGAQPTDNWSWERDADTVAHFRRYAELHLALVPLWEGLAGQAAATGLPIWRGMALEFPDDERCWPIVDQVMVGSSLLVAPVVGAAAESRSVYLPAGRWYRWGGAGFVDGPAELAVAAPLEEIPVFARAGGVVPTYPGGVMTLVRGSAAVPDPSTVGDDRVIYAFAGASGRFDELGGLAYSLQSPAPPPGGWSSGALLVSYEGVPLDPCGEPAVAPCVRQNAGEIEAHVRGAGGLAVAAGGELVARLRAAGGSPLRRLVLRVRL